MRVQEHMQLEESLSTVCEIEHRIQGSVVKGQYFQRGEDAVVIKACISYLEFACQSQFECY